MIAFSVPCGQPVDVHPGVDDAPRPGAYLPEVIARARTRACDFMGVVYQTRKWPAKVTLQPLEAGTADAAILFSGHSDTSPDAMGGSCNFEKTGEGPRFANGSITAADIER